MLLMGSISVGCKKFECRRNIRAVASVKPIDTADDALIYLFLAGKIMVKSINRRYLVYWVNRAIRNHIRDIVGCVDREVMGGELC